MKQCLNCFQLFRDEFFVCPHCGQIYDHTPLEPIHLSPGTCLADRYLVGYRIGSGGFGIVYKAWDLKLEVPVAIKEFFVPRLMTRAVGIDEIIVTKKAEAEFQYRKKRFLAEARNMAKFGSHRSITNVLEFFEANNTAYIVMELLEGKTLGQYMAENNSPLDTELAIKITNEVCSALISMHESGIIHRDVAPDNIYMCNCKETGELKIKLMDLGAAKLADGTDEAVDIILKPGYSPVEQYENGGNVGPWTDIYALGATLYAMLTGVKPDESTNRKIQDEILPPHQLNPQIDDNLSNAIMKAIAVDQHMRFRSIQDFLKAVNGEKKVIPLAKERRNRSIRRAIWSISACLLLVVGFWFSYHVYAGKQSQEALAPAEISVWFSVLEGSSEEAAMQAVKDHFEDVFPDVTLNMRAIPAEEYETEIMKAAQMNNLPTLFESSGLPDSILMQAMDLTNVLSSLQFETAYFLDQYHRYYKNEKQLPLAIEIPVAFLITNGAMSVSYDNQFFQKPEDFKNTVVAIDENYSSLIEDNFPWFESEYGNASFLNNERNESAVLLSSTMAINQVRTMLTNYEKSVAYPDTEQIRCRFTYEWSIGNGDAYEIEAAEKLLSWMLGNVYQSFLMISMCNDGQIPINPFSFESKINSKFLSPIQEIYQNFIFEKR